MAGSSGIDGAAVGRNGGRKQYRFRAAPGSVSEGNLSGEDVEEPVPEARGANSGTDLVGMALALHLRRLPIPNPAAIKEGD